MKKLYILLFSFFMAFIASAQENLFPNPGFEEYLSCYDTLSKDSTKLVKHWSNPTDKEALPTNLCEEGGSNYIKAIESRTGSAVQYLLIWYNDPRNFNIFVLWKQSIEITAQLTFRSSNIRMFL